MSGRTRAGIFTFCISTLFAGLACQSSEARRPAPAAHPSAPPGAYPQYPYPQQPPPQGYPPPQYPPPQYPAPQGYPPPQAYPAPPSPAAPAPAAPAPPAPAANAASDPLRRLDAAWLRQRAQAILAELTQALPEGSRQRVAGIPLLVDDTPGDVNAFAACSEGRSLMAVTDGMLEIMAWLAMSAANDELFGTQKTDEYITFIAQNLAPSRPLPRPAGFFSAAHESDGRRLQRQHVLFEEELAFVLGHELAHHYLGHLPCTGNPGPLGVGDALRVLSSQVPLFNQPNEAAADVAGTTNVLDAGARRSGARWSEQGALLTMRFFSGLGRGLAESLLLGFMLTHPHPQTRVPLIQQSASYWRQTGGARLPLPALGG